MPTLIKLSSGRLTATLNPAGGGTVASFQVDRRGRVDDLLRRAGAEAVESGDPLGASCFPLVPFFGFVRSGHIPIAGNERPMAANHASESFPIHGDGWLAPWEVTDAEGDRTTLAYVHDGARGTPYPYRATLGFALSETGLSVEVAVRNTGPEAVPAGLGLHPYFPKTADVELRVRATGAWPEPPTRSPWARGRCRRNGISPRVDGSAISNSIIVLAAGMAGPPLPGRTGAWRSISRPIRHSVSFAFGVRGARISFAPSR